jgi:2',3'-cyclic-nucleotide 2'-phosphodiesterase
VTLLFIGDIFGKVGRDLVVRALRPLVERYEIDLVVANAENSAGGFGVTREVGDAILKAGVDVMTSGNHVWDKKEVLDYIQLEPRLLRPANYPHGVPGCGSLIARTKHGDEVGVVNVMGRVFMTAIDDPFRIAQREIERIRERTPLVLVDFHAEATSEKIAMGWHLDGTATMVVGTHTHVQTADEQILPQGTAYITDVGMTGPHDGVIGVERQPVITRFMTGLPARFESAGGNPKLHAVVVNADSTTGKAKSITRLSLTKAEIESLPR